MSIKFSIAIDSETGNERTVRELDMIPNGDERLKHLQCPICSCSLSFRHSGVHQACFVTKKNVNHAENCEFKVNHENAKRQTRYTGVESVRLDDKARLSRAYSMFLKLKKQHDLDAGIELKRRGKRKKSAPKSLNKDDKTVVKNAPKLIPKITEESTIGEEQIQGRRVPTVYKYPNTLVENDVKQVINFGGYLEDVIIQANRVWLIISFGGVEKRLSINEAALNLAPINFDKLVTTLKYQLNLLDEKPIFSCVIETIPSSKDGSIQCMIRNVSDILINGKAVSVYLAKLNRNK